MTSLVQRTLNFKSRPRTGMRLEPELWDALDEIARRENKQVEDIVSDLEMDRPGSRTSAVRVFIVQYFRAAEHAHQTYDRE